MSVLTKNTKSPTWFSTAGFPSRVWRTQIAGTAGEQSISLPATGLFDIILIEVPKSSATPDQKAERPQAANVPKISDFIGYGRKFHPEYRSTEDVMRELREGEED